MPGGGAKPGERRGGRRQGKPNKKTIAIAEAAASELAALRAQPSKKLAKDVLDDFMMLFGGLATYYQPLPPGMAVPPGRSPDEAKFEKWARLTLEAATALAKYQSPTYKAIAVAVAQTTPEPKQTIDAKVIRLDDPNLMAKVYRNLVGGRSR